MALLLGIFATANAKEIIAIQSPYSAGHSGTPAMQKIIDQANQSQTEYQFILEFRPGGEQIIAVKYIHDRAQTTLAIIAPKFVEHTESGRLNRDDYVPVHALGDACWAVISNLGDQASGISSLRGQKEITVGGVGFGNASHLTSLEMGEKIGFTVRYIPFRSNFDALILMVGDNSINMVLDRVSNYQQFKEKNPRLAILAMSCPSRHPDQPLVQTLKEQGIAAPYVFNITVAHKDMDPIKRSRLSKILQDATEKVGRAEIQKLSDMKPPVFDKIDLASYYSNSISTVRDLLQKHKQHIPLQ